MPITTTGRATDFITFSRTSNATVTDSNGLIKWAGHNLLTNSESFDASAWTKSQSTATANVGVAPNGTTTADRIVGTGGFLWYVAQTISQAIGQKFTFGVWVKSNTGTPQTFRISGDAAWAVSSTLTATTSWQLFTLEFTATVAGSQGVGIITQSGNVAADILVWGAYCHRSDLGSMVLNPARGDAYYPTTPRNLLGWTESFDNAAWARTNVLAFGSGSVANAVNGPNGLRTADLLVEDTTASNTHFISQTTSSLAASRHVFSVYAKAAGRTWMALTIENWAAWFNLNSGAVGTVESGVTATITSVGDGWYRCAVYRTIASAGAKDCRVYLAATDGAAVYTGDGTSGIYLWGAQLSDSASLDAYSPVYGAAVTSAAYYAPRLDYDPVTLAAIGLLVEQQSTNLCLRSEEFDNASWTKSNLTVSANSTAAPSGATTADTLTATAGNATITQGVTTTAVAFTFSIYLKRKTGTGNIDITMDGTTWVTQTINSSTWTRCIVTQTGVAGTSNPGVRIVTNGDEVYAWGAQAE